MNTILRIYFAGLIALSPGGGDTGTLDVLLLDARGGHHTATAHLEGHLPMVLARSARCTGECSEGEDAIAEMIFRDRVGWGHVEPTALLRDALDGGGAWTLDDVQLELDFSQGTADALRIVETESSGRYLPADSEEARSFRWVADLADVLRGQGLPDAGRLDPRALADDPGDLPVTARLRLDRGTLRTHRLIRVGDGVPSFEFRSADADAPPGADVAFEQALANWVVVEIPLDGCEVGLRARPLRGDGDARRMRLAPSECDAGEVIEVAFLNTPGSGFGPPSPTETGVGIDEHFSAYYLLADEEVPSDDRLVPRLPRREIEVRRAELPDDEPSPLVRAILPEVSRAATHHPFCPVAVLRAP